MGNFMKKLLLSVAVASALGLSGCGSDTISEIKEQVQQENGVTQPLSRIVFDPGEGIMSVPNDLLFSGTTDGTLNMPGETVDDGVEIDYADPSTAIGALDGWSTVAPFSIAIETAEGTTLDASTAALPGAVRIFEATLGGSLSPEEACQGEANVSACQIGTELLYGTHFVTKGSGNSIAIIPLMPLKASQGYLLAVTKVVKDSNNASIAPSSTYESVRLDVATQPLPLPEQLGLQTLINSYEDRLEESGVDVSDVIFSSVFTTQSTSDVFDATKLMMLSGNPAYAASLSALTDTGYTAGDMLVGAGAIDPTDATGAMIYAGASRASMYMASLTAPYFLETPTAENCVLEMPTDSLSVANCPSLFSRFSALGDSPVTVLGAVASGAFPQAALVAQYDLQKAAFGRGDFTGAPSQLVGMQFNVNTPEMPVYMDAARHLTKFNPIPVPKSTSSLDVLVSMPNIAAINSMRDAEQPMIEKPANGWPVMIYAHGITTNKENMLAFVGAMSEAGVAVIAIDQPLHGSRAGELSVAGMTAPLSAEDDATAYLNLASLLTGRDNVRQSVLDGLALRLALNAGVTDIDPTNVSFYGHSLGGITGTVTVASANTPVIAGADPFGINATAFFAPGGGIPGLLLESPSFAPVVKAGLTSSATFQGLLESASGLTSEMLAEMAVGDTAAYNALVDAVYAPFSAEFNFAAQTLLDSADPVNYASTLAGNTYAIHLMEVVGDDVNLPDQVVPNNTVNSPLAGTDPLVMLAGLTQVNTTTMTDDPEKGVHTVTRFTDGHHASILTTALAVPTNTTENNLRVLTEMQTQLASFIGSGGQALVVTDTSVIQTP